MGRFITLSAGNDRFTQSAVTSNAALQINALAGDDTIILDRTDDLGGNNRVDAGAGNDGVVSHKEQGNIILLGDGNDTYVGLGFGSFSSDQADQVSGGAGNDTFAVQTFKSQYLGDAGNDTFHSVGWANSFNGGTGSDTISYLPRSDDTTSGVTVDLAAGLAQTRATRQETLISIENVIGSNNNDAIFGSNGANRITGAQGFDQMTGRGGADQFVFRAAADARVSNDNVDIVVDFSRAQGDKINLHAMDANTAATGNQDFHLINTAFTGHAAELSFQEGFVQGDINGDGRADFQIYLHNVTAMQASDFIL